ncbi:discoidin domain-containing protein [Pelagicoccus sp. SDUM812003]|uniref:discoidin domain-containing protein n=1 Tax=Pelagicoccus sp. SDUM812003 TaxID=3041267 RepID=UPI00280EE7DE|nr:discoidin domain-containing protein [Pelagicoccus sp. SDUM812003]MDQ8201609.1 discoidin domain-containing protein [Pelagicoccus sp. SDUM812003]
MKKKLITLSLATALAFPLFAEKAPINLEFPPPFLSGTPVPINLPNLESPDAPQPEIMAPADIENIAYEKEVTSSDDFPIIGELELVTDGDKESEEGYFVELAQGLQWVQIDLEEPATLYGIGVWHFHTQKRAYVDMVIQVSNDPEFEEGVTTIFNNDHDNSAGFGVGKDMAYIETNKGKLINAKQATGRYVRLYSDGNTSNEMNHYVEVEVFGVY